MNILPHFKFDWSPQLFLLKFEGTNLLLFSFYTDKELKE